MLTHKECVSTHKKSKARPVSHLAVANGLCQGKSRETGQMHSGVLPERFASLFDLQAGLSSSGSYLVAFAPVQTCSIPGSSDMEIPQISCCLQNPPSLSVIFESAS